MDQAWRDFLGFLDRHQIATGFVLGFLANYLNSLLQDWRTKRGLKANQQRFIEDLNESMAKYLKVTPKDEGEVTKIREEVALKVKELSKKIFGRNSFPFESVRLDSTAYPEIDCKWCKEKHQAYDGPRGNCQNCNLPLDVWIGIQREDTPKRR